MNDSRIYNNKIESEGVCGQSGNALLLSLLIVSAILTTTMTLTSLTISGIRQSRNISDSILAYYAAESGLEKSLYQIRTHGKSIEEDDADAIDFSGNVENGARWELVADESKNEVSMNLDDLASTQFDLFSPQDLNTPSGIQSVSVSWDGEGIVQATLLEIPAISDFSWNAGSSVKIAKEHVYTDDFILNLSAANLYKLRLKSLRGDIRNLHARLYTLQDARGDVVEIPNMIVIHSTGSFGRTSQGVHAEFPRFVPVSGVFDYVLFSESDIEKIVTEE